MSNQAFSNICAMINLFFLLLTKQVEFMCIGMAFIGVGIICNSIDSLNDKGEE